MTVFSEKVASHGANLPVLQVALLLFRRITQSGVLRPLSLPCLDTLPPCEYPHIFPRGLLSLHSGTSHRPLLGGLRALIRPLEENAFVGIHLTHLPGSEDEIHINPFRKLCVGLLRASPNLGVRTDIRL